MASSGAPRRAGLCRRLQVRELARRGFFEDQRPYKAASGQTRRDGQAREHFVVDGRDENWEDLCAASGAHKKTQH